MLTTFTRISSRYLSQTATSSKPQICIVGAGAAGFYAAQHLVKKLTDARVDIIEKLPVPFGLVRFGVAPDHPEVKNVINTFTKTAEHPNVNFFGNIELGKDVSLDELRKFYHVVLLTYGAEQNRMLGIPGENLKNVIPARKIVGWYNGLPGDQDLDINLNVDSMAIVGQGNVAMDVARILLAPIDELKVTDITQHALDRLSESKVKKVHLIGRRGPLQAAFTIKELREMLKLKNCNTVWRPNDFKDIGNDTIAKLARPRKRITELMLKSIQEQNESKNGNNVFSPIFLRSPIEILGKENNVEKLVLGVNVLEGDDLANQNARLTDERETIDCGLVVSSIGYKSVQADNAIPFDTRRGVVQNTEGKVDTGLYASGWLGTGPVGVILSTMSNAFGVAERIVQDLSSDTTLNVTKPGFSEVNKILKEKNVQIVEWKDWEKIDQYEVSQGAKVGKPREKLVDIGKMLDIAAS